MVWIMDHQQIALILLSSGTTLILVWTASKIDDIWKAGVLQSEAKAWQTAFVEAYKRPATKVYVIGTIYVLVTTFLGVLAGTMLGLAVWDIVELTEMLIGNG